VTTPRRHELNHDKCIVLNEPCKVVPVEKDSVQISVPRIFSSGVLGKQSKSQKRQQIGCPLHFRVSADWSLSNFWIFKVVEW
jgi:hypothetical protein